MARIPSWRVRVKRWTECWVDVQAPTAAAAEIEAVKVPGVLAVFTRSAIPSDHVAAPERPAGVRED